MLDDEDEIFLDGELIDLEELRTILRWLCIDLVLDNQPSVIIEHADHLTLQ
jgi:hypothetical protein